MQVPDTVSTSSVDSCRCGLAGSSRSWHPPAQRETWFVNPFIGDRRVRSRCSEVCPLLATAGARSHARARRADRAQKRGTRTSWQREQQSRPAVLRQPSATSRPANLRYTWRCPGPLLLETLLYVYLCPHSTFLNRGQLKLFARKQRAFLSWYSVW